MWSRDENEVRSEVRSEVVYFHCWLTGLFTAFDSWRDSKQTIYMTHLRRKQQHKQHHIRSLEWTTTPITSSPATLLPHKLQLLQQQLSRHDLYRWLEQLFTSPPQILTKPCTTSITAPNFSMKAPIPARDTFWWNDHGDAYVRPR